MAAWLGPVHACDPELEEAYRGLLLRLGERDLVAVLTGRLELPLGSALPAKDYVPGVIAVEVKRAALRGAGTGSGCLGWVQWTPR